MSSSKKNSQKHLKWMLQLYNNSRRRRKKNNLELEFSEKCDEVKLVSIICILLSSPALPLGMPLI